MYIQFNANRLGTPEAKIIFTAIYLRDRAFDWFKLYLNNHLENAALDQKHKTIVIFASYNH
jgi:hypothetical protein